MANIALRVENLSDLCHCTADNAAVGAAFGYTPAVGLAEGLASLTADSAGAAAANLTVARRELALAGLLR